MVCRYKYSCQLMYQVSCVLRSSVVFSFWK
jgi:hypothetical protein